jgi:hypothetical protein
VVVKDEILNQKPILSPKKEPEQVTLPSTNLTENKRYQQ